ncbi:site-specific DNA-methyltransferase, partial [Enterococcus cecorum]|nr:site-specific DNA-methyltransferase [Enterococcus cecorum]
DIDDVTIKGVPISNEDRYKQSDEYESTRGKYYLQKLGMGSIQYSESLDYPIETPDGSYVMPTDNNNGKKACWRWSRKKFDWGVENGFVEIKKNPQNEWIVYTKQYLNADNDGNIISRSQRPMGVIETFSSTQGAKQLKNIVANAPFSYPKD